jgi:hypothetical protein
MKISRGQKKLSVLSKFDLIWSDFLTFAKDEHAKVGLVINFIGQPYFVVHPTRGRRCHHDQAISLQENTALNEEEDWGGTI